MAEINWPDFQFPPVNLWVISAQSINGYIGIDMNDEQVDEIVKIFQDSGMTIELGAQYSVKGQIAQLLNGCEVLINKRNIASYGAVDESEHY